MCAAWVLSSVRLLLSDRYAFEPIRNGINASTQDGKPCPHFGMAKAALISVLSLLVISAGVLNARKSTNN
jgi:hypothetical protein